jgi:glycogen(starch) synthase
MRIAFISYECAPDTAFGGIGTYVMQAARALAGRDHLVEVFSASPTADSCQRLDGVTVHRLRHVERETFGAAIASLFAERHHEMGFDVLEGPEYQADAAEAVALVPEIPLVVRLHTPSYLVWQMSAPPTSHLRRLRVRLGAWRRGLIATDSPKHPCSARERIHTVHADCIVSPSIALARVIARDWEIPREGIRVIPNFFVPDPAYLAIEAGGDGRTVTYVGRLQPLKGVLDLAAAIPTILERVPRTRFRFVGRSMESPQPGVPMEVYLRKELRAWEDHLEFTGGVPPSEVASHIADAQVCVFPSRWEAFGYTCVEAMSAARAVIATSGSGAGEVLGQGLAGVLVPPASPRRLAKAIVRLVTSPDLCLEFGARARKRVLAEYSAAAIGPLQEAGYRAAIEKRCALGPRRQP